MLQRDIRGSLPTLTIPRGGVDVCYRTPTHGCSPIQNHFREAFHLLNIPCNVGEGWGGIYHQHGWKISGEAVPIAILVMDSVGEGNLGMVTTFCHHDQAKAEASEALSALHRCNLPEPSTVVVQGFTNSPYLPQGSFGLLYLGMTTLWWHFIHPISTGQTTSTQATPLLHDWGDPALGGGTGRVKGLSLLPRDPVG